MADEHEYARQLYAEGRLNDHLDFWKRCYVAFIQGAAAKSKPARTSAALKEVASKVADDAVSAYKERAGDNDD